MTHANLDAMPVAEKIQLMESLWESLSNNAIAALAVPAWHGDLLDERGALLDQGQKHVSAWGDGKNHI
jgi:hypothetical protein